MLSITTATPRNFTPDPEASTEKQRERHQEVLERRERQFAIGFGNGGTYDKVQDERYKGIRRLIEKFGTVPPGDITGATRR